MRIEIEVECEDHLKPEFNSIFEKLRNFLGEEAANLGITKVGEISILREIHSNEEEAEKVTVKREEIVPSFLSRKK